MTDPSAAELAFWRTHLREQAASNPDLVNRLDPERALQPAFERYLDPHRDRHRLLDVGSGPLTTLGRRSSKGEIEITAVDVLAREYGELLQELELRAPNPSRAVPGEALTAQLPRDHYHLTVSNNALDHTSDPLLCLAEMLRVTVLDGVVYLRHWAREGSFEGWRGMHRWDLDLVEGRFLITDADGRQCDVTTLLEDCACQVEGSHEQPVRFSDGRSKQLFQVVYRRTGTPIPDLCWASVATRSAVAPRPA